MSKVLFLNVVQDMIKIENCQKVKRLHNIDGKCKYLKEKIETIADKGKSLICQIMTLSSSLLNVCANGL